MNISLNRKTPMVYDFLLVIMFRHNGIDHIKRLAEGGHRTSDRVREAFDFIWDNLDTDVKGLDLFFHYTKENRCFSFNYTEGRMHVFEDINALITDLFEGPSDELKVKLLKYYDEQEKEDDFYKELLNNTTELYEFTTSLEIPVKCKWELYGFMMNPDEFLEPMKVFCHRVKRKIKNVYKENNEFIKNFSKEISVKIKNQPDQFFGTDLKRALKRDLREMGKDVEITFSLMNEYMLYIYTADNIRHLILGVNYEESIKNIYSGESAEVNDAFLKVFSDKHRMSIFRSLLNKEMYVGEIAKEHDMILSTTSYHLDLLLSAGILASRPQGKKVYYHVNKDGVSSHLRKIADLIEEGKF